MYAKPNFNHAKVIEQDKKKKKTPPETNKKNPPLKSSGK